MREAKDGFTEISMFIPLMKALHTFLDEFIDTLAKYKDCIPDRVHDNVVTFAGMLEHCIIEIENCLKICGDNWDEIEEEERRWRNEARRLYQNKRRKRSRSHIFFKMTNKRVSHVDMRKAAEPQETKTITFSDSYLINALKSSQESPETRLVMWETIDSINNLSSLVTDSITSLHTEVEEEPLISDDGNSISWMYDFDVPVDDLNEEALSFVPKDFSKFAFRGAEKRTFNEYMDKLRNFSENFMKCPPKNRVGSKHIYKPVYEEEMDLEAIADYAKKCMASHSVVTFFYPSAHDLRKEEMERAFLEAQIKTSRSLHRRHFDREMILNELDNREKCKQYPFYRLHKYSMPLDLWYYRYAKNDEYISDDEELEVEVEQNHV